MLNGERLCRSGPYPALIKCCLFLYLKSLSVQRTMKNCVNCAERLEIHAYSGQECVIHERNARAC